MNNIITNCAPMAVGSFPYKEPSKALEMIFRYFSRIPLWPQLPMAHYLEQMYIQYHQGIPGITLDPNERKLTASPVDDGFFEEMANAMEPVLNEDYEAFALTEELARGFFLFMENVDKIRAAKPLFVKGQVTGPVSFALSVTDTDLKPIIYDESYREAVVEVLKMKAIWQLDQLRKICDNAVIFVDEPYLASIGSSMVAVSAEDAAGMVGAVTGAILEKGGIPGVHCCGNTDWSYLLNSPCMVLSFDAYEYGETLLLYPDAVAQFLKKGGILAWGIVPTTEAVLEETPESLAEKLKSLIKKLQDKGISEKTVLRQSLITPSCGLGNLSPELAETIMKTTVAVSELMQKEFQAVRS